MKNCCFKCSPTVKVTNVTVGTVGITLTVGPFSGTLPNCNRFFLCVYPDPALNSDLPVLITDGTNTWNLVDCCVNNIEAKELLGRCTRKLKVCLSSDNKFIRWMTSPSVW